MVYRSIGRPCKICGKWINGGMGVASHMAKHTRERERGMIEMNIKAWAKKEETRLRERIAGSSDILERTSLEGSLITIRKLRAELGD